MVVRLFSTQNNRSKVYTNMTINTCTRNDCNCTLESFMGIYYCPKCKFAYLNDLNALKKLHTQTIQKRKKILRENKEEILGYEFWAQFLTIESVVNELIKNENALSITATRQTHLDAFTFLEMCRKIEKAHPSLE